MAPVFKIAVIQLHPLPLQPKANFENAAGFIRSAAAQNCQLAVLPEYHLTSWVPDDPQFRTVCAESAGPYLEAYQALARECNICIVPGTLVEGRGDVLVNTAYFIDHTGAICGRYVKRNLWHPERPHLASEEGDVAPSPTACAAAPAGTHRAFDTPLGRVGMLICWDLAFPEAFRALIADGARLLVVPSFWTLHDCDAAAQALNPLSEELLLNSMLVSRAYENTCAVVYCNAGGPPGGTADEASAWAGLSQVAQPFLGGVGRLGREQGVSIVDLDMAVLDLAEANYLIRADMAREGWHYGYTLPGGRAETT